MQVYQTPYNEQLPRESFEAEIGHSIRFAKDITLDLQAIADKGLKLGLLSLGIHGLTGNTARLRYWLEMVPPFV